ncbi:sigma 54-interacting transcriptional regulator [Pediococcus cellicola]|uniref:DNA translocase FtsK n=1 Tax=Pediococcus cellicola TaxID=319652 RepID=A0A0R2IJ59_9LACO|nr:sigma 54-interacting transcriptional regulator [Pediococcus cellicola]KRN65055.1 transcriptional regulator [Pediococcus cellicola]GEL15858.1 transcriptional regulator [Pediococcus cellicola]
MKSTDNIYNFLIKEHPDDKLTTQQIASSVGLSRGVVSSYLSQLYRENRLVKSGTRPVYWMVRREVTEFSKVIGYNGSLAKIIKQCTEAIIYPPKGFPLIITGPSGIGKSYLAKIIFEEAKRRTIINKDANFVVLNTADYANNPELLSSILFGFKKGAFTGADKDTPGLVDQANNGYLFLDEIHRLPTESQEKLFSLLDSGKFYPLGENKEAHKVNVRFIFATTEKLDNFMLKTFMRRVPMHIDLPAFRRRPFIERFELVFHAFRNEAKRTGRSIEVSLDQLNRLVRTDKPGNIGAMENDVQLICASGFENVDENECIFVGKPGEPTIFINANSSFEKTSYYSDLIKDQVIKLQKKTSNLLNRESSLDDLSLAVDQMLKATKLMVDEVLIKDLKIKVYKNLKEFLGERYGVDLNLDEEKVQQIASAFSLGELFNEDTVQLSKNELQKSFKKRYPRCFYLFRQFILHTFKRSIREMDLFCFPLMFQNKCVELESIHFTGILLAHGRNTATSIQSVVNNLCGNYIFEAFDMPIDVSIHDINEKVQHYLNQKGQSKDGIFVLFDMGSLNQMFKEIKHSSDDELLVINNLTTAMALDIGIRIQRGDSFKQITKAAQKFGDATGVQYYEGLSDRDNIIVSCMSGVGISEEIKKMMAESLSGKEQIITMDYKDLQHTLDTHEQDFFHKTNLVITTTNIETNLDISIINIYDIMEKPGYQELKRLLIEAGETPGNVDHLMESLLKFFSLEGIKDRLQFLNPDVVINEAQQITAKYQDYYQAEFEGKVRLNLYMHLSLMIERMLIRSHKDNEYTEIPLNNEQEKEFFSVSHAIFKGIEIKYNFKVDDYEISLMYQLLKSYI